jgi:hypothetical protein
MNRPDSSTSTIAALAGKEAAEVFALEKAGGDGLALRKEQLRNFQLAYQPLLSDKEYTALFRTYDNLFMTAMKNQYAPGSAVAAPAVTPESIKDGDEIYRPNAALAMDPIRWRAFLADVEKMAERFAKEIAALAASGADAGPRMKEHQMEAAKFALDHGVDDAQFVEQAAVYKAKYLATLEAEATARQNAKAAGPDDKQCRQMVDDLYRAFLPHAFAGEVEKSRSLIMAFEDKVQKIARELPGGAGQAFLKRLNAHRDNIANEYERDRQALRRRLGVAEMAPPAAASAGQQLGDLAVRTAVRATVWESVRAFFRLLR